MPVAPPASHRAIASRLTRVGIATPASLVGTVSRLSRRDPVLMLLGALALGVLVLSSLTLLRLVARVRGDGPEGRMT